MNLVARLLLETSGFVQPAQAAVAPLQRVKGELAAVGREADKLASRSGGGAAPLLLGGGSAAGVAATAAPVALALQSIRTQTAAVAQEMRRAAAPVADLRREFRALAIEAGGGGGRRMINVTGTVGGAGGALITAEMARMIQFRRMVADGHFQRMADGIPGDRMKLQFAKDLAGDGRQKIAAEAGLFGSARQLMGGQFAGMGKLFAGGAVGAGLMKTMFDASEMEDYQTSFATLLGSLGEAENRMRDLAKFAETTPFELPEVAAASRVLETLTRGALSTGDGLRMVGDVAANVKQPIQELAMWIGRTYDGLQNGRPVGEALMRLQELGVMSGDVRSRIESLQEQGKRGDEVWSVAAASFGRFAGEMERRSATLSGRMANFWDSLKGMSREIGSVPLEMAKVPVAGLSRTFDRFAEIIRDAKQFWFEAAGGLSDATIQARFPGPSGGPKAGPKPPPTDEQLSAAIAAFFDPIDRMGAAKQQLKGNFSDFRRLNRERVLNDPFSSDVDRVRALNQAAQETFAGSGAGDVGPGVRFVPGSADEAMARVKAEIEYIEAIKATGPLTEAAAQKMKLLIEAFEKLVGISGQLQGIRANSVDRALEEFFGPLDETSTTMKNHRPSPQFGAVAPLGDRLARIGGFIGGGGPALDYARRTAEATIRTAQAIEKIAHGQMHGSYDGSRAVWG